jgi:hypothetical protein
VYQPNHYSYNFGVSSSNWSGLFSSTGSSNSSKIIAALQAGKMVLLDFNIYDSSVTQDSKQCTTYGANLSPNGNAAYVYDATSGQLTLEAPNGQNNNTWYSPTGCLMGGHQVWVVGYATSGSNYLFVIRNSWGPSGDQGQYYMTDTYLNGAATYAAAVVK